MQHIEWIDGLCTGVTEIDEDHKVKLVLINTEIRPLDALPNQTDQALYMEPCQDTQLKNFEWPFI